MGIHGTKDLKTEKFPLKLSGLHSNVHPIEAFARPSISYYYNQLKQSFNHLSVLFNKIFKLMQVVIILGQDAYQLQRPLKSKIGTQKESFVDLKRARIGIQWTLDRQKSGKICYFAFTEDVKVAEDIQNWWDIETYASKIIVHCSLLLVIQRRSFRHKRCWREEQSVHASSRKWDCWEVNQSQAYRILESALLTGAKIPDGSKPERFVSTVHISAKMVSTNISRKPNNSWGTVWCRQKNNYQNVRQEFGLIQKCSRLLQIA